MADDKDSAVVTYRVSDLLDQIKIAQAQGFARLEANLNMKADKSDVVDLGKRLDGMDGAVGELKAWKREKEITNNIHFADTARRWTWKRRTVAVIASIGMMLATILGPYLAIHLHL